MPAHQTIQICTSEGHLHEKPVPGDNIVVISQAPKGDIKELRERILVPVPVWQGWHVAWYIISTVNIYIYYIIFLYIYCIFYFHVCTVCPDARYVFNPQTKAHSLPVSYIRSPHAHMSGTHNFSVVNKMECICNVDVSVDLLKCSGEMYFRQSICTFHHFSFCYSYTLYTHPFESWQTYRQIGDSL